MRKQEQMLINEEIMKAIENYNKHQARGEIKFKRLRTCSAQVREDDLYYTLISYNTVIAFIDKETNTLYDFLRYVYGYTSTSAQHIAKFRNDYKCTKELRYYPI